VSISPVFALGAIDKIDKNTYVINEYLLISELSSMDYASLKEIGCTDSDIDLIL